MASDDGSFQILVSTLEAKISSSPSRSPVNCCIYRVPPLLRRNNEQAYTPSVISIGPLHHKDDKFLPMETHKIAYLRSFLDHSPNNINLTSYLNFIKNREMDIRKCYADTIPLSSRDFVQMVLIDSVFIIELLRRRFNASLQEENDFIYVRPFMLEAINRDIKLEENQLPFFILVSLYRAAFKSGPNLDKADPSFTDLACQFLNVNKNKIDLDNMTNEATSCLNLLDLLRSDYKPSDLRTQDHFHRPVCPTATDLSAAGVRFQVHESSNKLDISFDRKNGILKIPKLRVADSTEYLHRNLMAFEQCHYYPHDTYFTSYHLFLDWLINTPEDVELLVKQGIIENWLGSNKQVSDLINSLSDDIYAPMQHYNYMEVTEQLIIHCDKKWNRYKATLKQTYFQHPWAIISVIYAAILLVLTMIQVITGILAVPNVLKGN